MNITFFGSSEFAVPSMDLLMRSGHKIIGVVTQPDKAKGRGLALSTTAVKDFAGRASLPIYQPVSVNSPDMISMLTKMQPDLFVVIAYGQLLSAKLLSVPKLFSVNLHASLLPKFRGAAPVNWAIIRGERQTGVTIIKLVQNLDAGPIISQKAMAIQIDDTAVSLKNKLAIFGAGLLASTLDNIKDNSYSLKDQDAGCISLAPKLKKSDGLIDWSKPADEIFNLIRGCFDWPGAYTKFSGRTIKIYKSRLIEADSKDNPNLAGTVDRVCKDGLVVITGRSKLLLLEVQPEGKRVMSAVDFVAGHRILPGDKLG